MKRLGIALIGILMAYLFVSAEGTKTYIYKPLNPASEITEIWIETDGSLQAKDSAGVEFIVTMNNQTIQTFTALDSTPSVQGYNYFTLPSAANTYITDFDNGTAGQMIFVRGSNTAGTIVMGTNILGWGGNISLDTNDMVSFIYDGAEWMMNSYFIEGDYGSVPLATTTTRGVVKVGSGLTMTGDSIGVVTGTGITVTANAITSAITAGDGLTLTDADIDLDVATTTTIGGAKVGYGVTMTGDSIGLALSHARAVFDADDGTPSVSGGMWFVCSSDSGAYITDFDDGVDGQRIYVMGSNTSRVFDFTTSELVGSSSDITLDTNDMLQFIYSEADTKWILVGKIDASANNSW